MAHSGGSRSARICRECGSPWGTVQLTHLPGAKADGDIGELEQRTTAPDVGQLIAELNDPVALRGLRVEGWRPGESDPAIVVDIGVSNTSKDDVRGAGFRDALFGEHRLTSVRVVGPEEQWVRQQCLYLVDILRPTEFWGRLKRVLLDLLVAVFGGTAVIAWGSSFVHTAVGDKGSSEQELAGVLTIGFLLLALVDRYLSRSVVLLRPRPLEKLLLKLNRHHRRHFPLGIAVDVTLVLALLGLLVGLGQWLLPVD